MYVTASELAKLTVEDINTEIARLRRKQRIARLETTRDLLDAEMACYLDELSRRRVLASGMDRAR